MTDDDGSVTILILGLTAVVLMVLAGLTQAAHLFLEQRSLAGVCDGAADAGAQALDISALYVSDARVLGVDQARREVHGWLTHEGSTADARGVVVTVDGLTRDRLRVSVTCTRKVDVSFSRVVGIGATTLTAHSTGRIP